MLTNPPCKRQKASTGSMRVAPSIALYNPYQRALISSSVTCYGYEGHEIPLPVSTRNSAENSCVRKKSADWGGELLSSWEFLSYSRWLQTERPERKLNCRLFESR